MALVARTTGVSEMLASELGGCARAYQADASDPSALAQVFRSIQRDLGDVDVLVYNAGSGVWGTVEEIAPDVFEAAWRVNALGRAMTCRPGLSSSGCASRCQYKFAPGSRVLGGSPAAVASGEKPAATRGDSRVGRPRSWRGAACSARPLAAALT